MFISIFTISPQTDVDNVMKLTLLVRNVKSIRIALIFCTKNKRLSKIIKKDLLFLTVLIRFSCFIFFFFFGIPLVFCTR